MIAAVLVILLYCIGFRLDMTANHEYSLEPQTKQLLDALPQPVSLYVLHNPEGTDAKLSLLLESYTHYTSKISITPIDTALQPDLVMRLSNNTAVKPGTLFAQCGSQTVSADPATFYIHHIDYTTMHLTPVQFCGQAVINGLIASVIHDDAPVIHILEGHNEQQLPPEFFVQVRREGITAVTLNVLKGDTMPTDTRHVIFINDPQQDITAGEQNMLQSFIQSGGALLLTGRCSAAAMPHLSNITALFGISSTNGIVQDTNTSFTVQNKNTYLRPIIHPHPVTNILIETKKPVVIPESSGITITTAPAETAVLLTASADAVVITPDGTSVPAAYMPVAAASRTAEGGQLVFVSSSGLTDQTIDQLLTAGGNNMFLMTIITRLTGNRASWTVPQYDESSSYVQFSSHQINSLTILSAIVLPACCFAAAFIIRKNRKRR